MQFIEDFFVYQSDFLAIAAAATVINNIQVQADSDFKWTKGVQFSDIATAIETQSSRVLPIATVQILDSGSGRQLTSSAVPVCSLFGEGDLPFILPVPRIFAARSNIQVTVVNLTGGTTYNIRMSFMGTKIFGQGKGS